jgi:hypothetical protein
MRGWPGVGKTTLVNALANSPEVLAAFPDGLLWAAVGESANPLAHLTRWAQDLGSSGAPKTVDEAQMSVRALLAKKRALLIVDDVWDPVTAAAFKVGGPQCSLLITTRMTDIARSIAATPAEVYVLGQLSDENAAQLFAQLAPQVAAQHPVEARRLALELEGLPLAIRVAGRLLEAEARMGWGILNLLEEFAGLQRMLGETAPDDRFDQATGTVPTVSHLLKQSTDRLDSVTRDRYALLGAFAPKPATFDLDAMQAVWEAGDPLDARATARTLADRGLLEPIIGTGRFQVHALLVAHARSLLD